MPSASVRTPTGGPAVVRTRAAARRRHVPIFLAALLLVTAAGCAHVNPYFDPSKSHHTPTGFRNSSGVDETKSLWDVATWLLLGERPQAPPGGWRIPAVAPDLAALRSPNAGGQVTWIGHATVLVQMGGVNLLTDPQFSERASPFSWIGPKRHVPPGVPLADLPRIDVVFVSHSHYDHLDLPSLRALARQAGGPPVIVVPLGLAPFLAAEGIPGAVELDWWGAHRVGNATVHVVPAHHWSARTRFDKNETLWGGVVMEAGGQRFVYTGDTGYSADFAEIGRRFGGFDLAAIPIGAYAPRYFMQPQHVDPAESVRVAIDLRARQSVGVHWGTFTLGDEPLDEPPVRLAEARAAAGFDERAFFALRIGETRVLDAGATRQR